MYLFVDESPSHDPTGRYIVGGCWCLSPYDDESEVLRSTIDGLRRRITSFSGTLKGERAPERLLDSVFTYLRNDAARTDRDHSLTSSDDSVYDGDLPWMHDSPVAFNFYDSDARIGDEIVRDYLGTSDGTVQQTLALASLVTPIATLPRRTTAAITEAVVIMDAETWERPAAALRSTVRQDSVRFLTKPDHDVPGIQFADAVANVRRRWLRHGECGRSMRVLAELSV
ncbi:MAG: DUF3800 domain-containing protein [Halobaculum sp.]